MYLKSDSSLFDENEADRIYRKIIIAFSASKYF